MPTLLIAGEADEAYVNDMRRMADLIPNSELVIIPGTGHAIHREYPDMLVKTIERFVQQEAAV